MNELQIKTRNQVLDMFKDLSSKKAQKDYKNAVPYVHIPNELISQWDGCYLIGRNWYREIWTKNQLEILSRFNTEFNRLIEYLPNPMPDVPDVFEDRIWQQIMVLSKEILTGLNENSG